MYIIPQRLTVAGDACSRSAGSKMRFILLLIWMISPLIKQSFLLSSRTVFMFSIQTASTGPSNNIQFRSSEVEVANSRKVLASTPKARNCEDSTIKTSNRQEQVINRNRQMLMLCFYCRGQISIPRNKSTLLWSLL